MQRNNQLKNPKKRKSQGGKSSYNPNAVHPQPELILKAPQ